MQELPGLVDHRNRHALGVEDLLDLVADHVVDRLHLELARKRRLDAVDQRQFGVPLPRFLDRPGPRERSTDVLPDEREQIPVLFRVTDVPGVRLDDKRADCPALRPERDAEPARLFDGDAERLDLTLLYEPGPALVVEELRRTLAQHVRRRAPRLAATEFVPLARVGDVEVNGVDVVREVDPLSLLVVERDEDVPRVHELADDLVDSAVELLHILGGTRQLGDAVQRVLRLGGVRPLCFDASH